MIRTLVSRVRAFALLVMLSFLCALSATSARADRCEDIARQLAGQIDGLKVNFSAGNIVYLTHPAARELSLGCRGQNYSIELYAKGDRRPKPEFYQLVGSAAAIIFTVPKDDTTTGASRCLNRMGILRGNKISMRFRRLNLECTRTRTEASITITRSKDE